MVCIIRRLSEAQSEVTHLQPTMADQINSQSEEISENVSNTETISFGNFEEASGELPFQLLFQIKDPDEEFAAFTVSSTRCD